jgi:hypothetical protein
MPLAVSWATPPEIGQGGHASLVRAPEAPSYRYPEGVTVPPSSEKIRTPASGTAPALTGPGAGGAVGVGLGLALLVAGGALGLAADGVVLATGAEQEAISATAIAIAPRTSRTVDRRRPSIRRKAVIDRSHPLSETAAAIRYLKAGHAREKVVITV